MVSATIKAMIRLKIYKPSRRAFELPAVREAPELPVVRERKKTSEKRQAGRSDHVAKFSYKLLVPVEGQGYTQNVSQAGYGLFLDKEVPPGATIELQFDTMREGNRPDKPIAKVMWQKDHQTGVKLLGK